MKNLENTVYDAKRLVGREFNDQYVQEDCKLWPFKVVPGGDNGNKPLIEVKILKQPKRLFPEEIQAKILEKLKQAAE